MMHRVSAETIKANFKDIRSFLLDMDGTFYWRQAASRLIDF